MGKLTLLAAVACLISCYGMNADGQTVVQSSFVGASVSSTNGSAGGIMGMNNLCKLSHGINAHMCTWDEFYHSAGTLLPTPASPVPALPNAALGLWAIASWNNCFLSPATAKFMCQESFTDSWVAPPVPSSASCSSWNTTASGTSGSAVIIQTLGVPSQLSQSFGFVPCATSMPVACCSQ